MADEATPVAAAASAVASVVPAVPPPSTVITLFGYNFNMAGIGIMLALAGILYLFYRIQKDGKLDFADLITKDGRVVSLTKVLQLVGGICGTWVIIKLTLTNGLSEAVFGLYLTYVGAIEGYSKFVAAKYGYNEKSVKDAASEATSPKE